MKDTILIVLSLMALPSHGKTPSETLVDVDFVLERNAPNTWDIRSQAVNQKYGEAFVSRSFGHDFTYKTKVDILVTDQGDYKTIETTTCVSPINPYQVSYAAEDCQFFEKSRFQFRIGEAIEAPSKVEFGSHYHIVVTEHQR